MAPQAPRKERNLRQQMRSAGFRISRSATLAEAIGRAGTTGLQAPELEFFNAMSAEQRHLLKQG